MKNLYIIFVLVISHSLFVTYCPLIDCTLNNIKVTYFAYFTESDLKTYKNLTENIHSRWNVLYIVNEFGKHQPRCERKKKVF